MRMNHKIEELINYMFNTTKEKFPEIEFKNVIRNPEDPDNFWINVFAPMDEDREIEFMEFKAHLSVLIEDDYGYDLSILH